MTDRIPGAPGRCKAVVTGEELQKLRAGEEFAITLRRDDQPIREGTPYSKAAVLPDALAATLCPGVDDPAPKDALAALYTQKADTVRRATGKMITLRDAAHTPLMGLKLYGKTTQNGTPTPDAPMELENAGDSGSVTVTVMGKNVADVRKFCSYNDIKDPSASGTLSSPYGTTISTNVGDSVTVTQSKYTNPSYPTDYNNGYFVVGFYSPLKIGDKIAISFNFKVTSNPLDADELLPILNNVSAGAIYAKEADTGRYQVVITVQRTPSGDWHNLEIRNAGKSGVFSNFQIEYGTTATEYEPYQEPQTLTLPTPNGLAGDELVWNEIDLAKGVCIRRTNVGERAETLLPDEVLEAYAKLHTYAPTTTITNDAGADMELAYYTPTTAVQMVHGPADKGKTFTIDEHGCVTLTKDNPVIACGRTRVDGCEWYYRKWADGCAECWTNSDINFNASRNVLGEVTIDIWLSLPFMFCNGDSTQVFAVLDDSIDSSGQLTGESILFCLADVGVDIGSDEIEGVSWSDIVIGFQSSNTTEKPLLRYDYQTRCNICVRGYWRNPEEV